MNPYAKPHEEARAYRLSRIKDAIEGNRAREQFFVSGGYIHPHVEPLGSFNRPTGYASNLAYADATLAGQGMRTVEGHAWKQHKNAQRAKQLAEKQALADGLPAPTDNNVNDGDDIEKVKTAFELFFNSIVDTDFSNMVGSDKEMKQAIGNLQKYGTTLPLNDLKRYATILEESIDGNITHIKGLVDEAMREERNPEQYASLLKRYEDNVENIEELELMYKMFLMLKALESTIDMDPQSRQMAFSQQFKEIIKANPRKIMPTHLFNSFEEAKKGLKELKDILPSGNYDVKKARRTAEAMAKSDSDDDDNDDNDDDDDDDDDGDTFVSYDAPPSPPSNNNGRAYFEPQEMPQPRTPPLPYIPQDIVRVAPPQRRPVPKAPPTRSPSVLRRRPTTPQLRQRSARTRKPAQRYNPSTGKGKKMNKIQSIIQKMKDRK